MSEQTAPEPTMEEILASIRRIISEDDAPAAEAEAAPGPEAKAPEVVAVPEPEPEPPVALAPEPEPAPQPVIEAEAEDDVLELTEKVDELPPVETHGDVDVYTKAEERPAPEPVAFTPPAADSLVGEPASVAAASAFHKLSATVAMPSEGRTLEDVTRELLRPLLKAWLDEHLPAIVQAKVEEEVERIARGRVR